MIENKLAVLILSSLLHRFPADKFDVLLIRIDFHVLKVWSMLTRPFAPTLFQSARIEIVAILENLAGRVAAQTISS